MILARSVRGVARIENQMLVRNEDLADRIRTALTADTMVGRIPITVGAYGSRVSLTSDQTTKAERERAIAIASAVPGVTHVEDDMR